MLCETGDVSVCILKKARRSLLAKGRASYQLCPKHFAGNWPCRNALVFTKLWVFPKFPFLPELFHSVILSCPLPWEIKHFEPSIRHWCWRGPWCISPGGEQRPSLELVRAAAHPLLLAEGRTEPTRAVSCLIRQLS